MFKIVSKNNAKKFSSENGFTLIELMLAIFIMTVGLMATFKMMSNFRDSTLLSRDEVIATNLGTRKLEDLMGGTFYYDHENSVYVYGNSADFDLTYNAAGHSDPNNPYFARFNLTWYVSRNIDALGDIVTGTTMGRAHATGDSFSADNNLLKITLKVSWQRRGADKSQNSADRELYFTTLKSAG